jgi:preprotein translocase SecE subunit
MDEKQGRRRRRRNVEEAEAVEAVEEVEVEESETDADDSGEQRGLAEKKGRPTPGRRNRAVEEQKDEGNVVTRTAGGVVTYLQDTRAEINKVTWPTRPEIRRLLIIVLVATIASALLLGAFSLIFTELIRIGLATPLVLVVFFIAAVAIGAGVYYYLNRRQSTV